MAGGRKRFPGCRGTVKVIAAIKVETEARRYDDPVSLVRGLSRCHAAPASAVTMAMNTRSFACWCSGSSP